MCICSIWPSICPPMVSLFNASDSPDVDDLLFSGDDEEAAASGQGESSSAEYLEHGPADGSASVGNALFAAIRGQGSRAPAAHIQDRCSHSGPRWGVSGFGPR